MALQPQTPAQHRVGQVVAHGLQRGPRRCRARLRLVVIARGCDLLLHEGAEARRVPLGGLHSGLRGALGRLQGGGIEPHEDVAAAAAERVFEFLYEWSERTGVAVKTTAAPAYRRVVVQREARRPPGAAPRPRPLPVNDGKGFVFVSHTGDVYPSGFLPLTTANVREARLAEVSADPVFGDQVALLADLFVARLPEGPQLYPDGELSDAPEENIAAELIREAALEGVRDELPHSIAVVV